MKPPRLLVSLDIKGKRTAISLQKLPGVYKNHPEVRDALRKNYLAPFYAGELRCPMGCWGGISNSMNYL